MPACVRGDDAGTGITPYSNYQEEFGFTILYWKDGDGHQRFKLTFNETGEEIKVSNSSHGHGSSIWITSPENGYSELPGGTVGNLFDEGTAQTANPIPAVAWWITDSESDNNESNEE